MNKVLEQSPIAKYHHAIQDGKINACYEIRTVYQHLYNNLYHPEKKYHYDADKANRVIDFCERFIHLPKVKGNPMVNLMLWQKALLSAVFGFVDDEGLRQYQEVCLIVGRKNAKSTLAGMISLYMLICDNEPQAEIYSAATKKEQAKILWQSAVDMVHKSEALRAYCKCHVADISCNLNGGIFKPLSSDSSTLDGLNSSVVFLDEIHAYKNSSLYDVMEDSTGARKQPLIILTSTAGFVRNGLYDAKIDEYQRIIAGYTDAKGYHDERRLPFIYKLDSAEEWTNPDTWIKANPGLGEIRSLEKLAEDVQRAKDDAGKKKDILTKFFDLPQTGQQHYFSIEDISNTGMFDIMEQKPRYGIGGFDLSQVNDLTSACILYQIPNDKHIYVLSMAWMPAESYEQHIQQDNVPYDIWKQKGWLRLCSGNKIDYHDVAMWFQEVQEKYDLYLYKIGYDRWSANYLVDELGQIYGKDTLIPIAQGAKTLSIPLQNMKSDFKNQNIVYNDNQLLKWCLLNLMVEQDSNGNYNTTKNRNDKLRDDSAMALLDALTVYYNDIENYQNLI